MPHHLKILLFAHLILILYRIFIKVFTLECNKDVIFAFHAKYRQLISDTPDCLLFGADETSLDPKLNKKVVVPSDLEKAIREGFPEFPHISSMCCSNILGKAPPLLIILKQLQNLPNELKQFEQNGKAWFASSNKGYMTRELFLLWSCNFINWLSSYRLVIDPIYRTKRALLILDGHLSRECPIAFIS